MRSEPLTPDQHIEAEELAACWRIAERLDSCACLWLQRDHDDEEEREEEERLAAEACGASPEEFEAVEWARWKAEHVIPEWYLNDRWDDEHQAIRVRDVVLTPEYIERHARQYPNRRKRVQISAGLRFSVLEAAGFKCVYCGRGPSEDVLEVDHVLPHKLGGRALIGNLVAACRTCNRGKGARKLTDH